MVSRSVFRKMSFSLLLNMLAILCFSLLGLLLFVNTAQASEITVDCSGTASSPSIVDEALLNNEDVTFTNTGGDGYCELDEPVSAASVIVETGVVITHPAEDIDGINITTTGDFILNGSLSADAKGCEGDTNGGQGPDASNICSDSTGGGGSTHNNRGGGGGYGGSGGAASATSGGDAYGSMTIPLLFGSSGGGAKRYNSGVGGAGGGLIQLNILGTFTHNGVVTSSGGGGTGTNRRGAGGGSGGSIYITAGLINGSTGVFTSVGGSGWDASKNNPNDGGGGGGGRIDVNYGGGTFDFDSSDFLVGGGVATGNSSDGAVGTVYLRNSSSDRVDIFHGFSYDDTSHTASTWVFDETVNNQYCVEGTVNPSIAADSLTIAGDIECENSSIETFSFSANNDFNLLPGTTLSITSENSIVDFDLPNGSSHTWSNIDFTGGVQGKFIIDDPVSISIEDSTMINASADWTNLVDLTIEAGSVISSEAMGCLGDNNTGQAPDVNNLCVHGGAGGGVSSSTRGAGGGYGGRGGSTINTSESYIYDSVSAPMLFGASGGGATSGTVGVGGTGGGLIRIDVSGTLTHNGEINSDGDHGNGNSSRGAGGGAGGSIYITANSFAGTTGLFSATGGDGYEASNQSDGGGGGGGRISLIFSESDFDLDASDFLINGGLGAGNSYDGGNGTVYTENTTTDRVDVYHAFSYDNSDYSATTWNFDSSVIAHECSDEAITPSITSANLTLAGSIDCTVDTVTEFTLSATSTFDIDSGTNINVTNEGANINIDLPAANSYVWSDVHINGAVLGSLLIDDYVNLTLSDFSSIHANIKWDNIHDLTLDSGSVISADGLGCIGDRDMGQGPDESNLCIDSESGAGHGSNWRGSGAGHGGAGGGTIHSSGGSTYGSETNPVLYGASGGGVGYGSTGTGGSGGGIIDMSLSGTLTNNGLISANGVSGTGMTVRGTGGGAGGSILIYSSVIDGSSGAFTAYGGDGWDATSNANNDGGGGGGGRIAIKYGNDLSTYLSSLTAADVSIGGFGPAGADDGSVGTFYTAHIPVLESISINDTNDSNYTNDSTVEMAIMTSGSTAAEIAFSCNDGEDWSDWIEYPDDDVMNDNDGPYFDITTGATGCSNTEELKTITAKVKNASDLESDFASDVTNYDVTSSTVSNVSSSNADGIYGPGEDLNIDVQFDEVVTGTAGLMTLGLDFDEEDRLATYSAGLDSDTITLIYTSQNGDNVSDLDYISSEALALNGDLLTDLAGNTATIALPVPGETGSLSANKAIEVSTNQEPIASLLSASQSVAENGDVEISALISDPDNDESLSVQLEYSLDAGETWNQATIARATSDIGTIAVDNAETYQIGGASAYISTVSGEQNLSIIWDADFDAEGVDLDSAQVRIAPTDQIATGVYSTSDSFSLDLAAPIGFGDLKLQQAVGRVDLNWSKASDPNFSHYEIYYSSDPSELELLSGSIIDKNIYTELYDGNTNFVRLNTDLSNNFLKVYAFDIYSNYSSLDTIFISKSTYVLGEEDGGSTYSASSGDENHKSTGGDNKSIVTFKELGLDLPEHWSNEYVIELESDIRILEVAAKDDTFLNILNEIIENPDARMNRGEALYFLLTLADYDTTKAKYKFATFVDLNFDNKFANAIQYAYEYGLVSGYDDNTFQADRIMNRAEALKLCLEFFQVDIDENIRNFAIDFIDIDSTAWYYPYLAFAVGNNIIDGYPFDHTFRPAQEISYSELLKVASLVMDL